MNKTESKSRSQKEFGKKNVLAQKQNKYRKQVQTAHKTLKKTIESKNRQGKLLNFVFILLNNH